MKLPGHPAGGLIVFITLLYAGERLDAQISQNVSLLGSFTPNPLRYSGSWGYTSPTGQEYALVGSNPGTYIVAIDDSLNIQQLGFVAGPASNWREITVVGNHAYVVTEGTGSGSGMQVIDLTNLPGGVSLLTTYNATFTRGHMISRDIYSDSAYVYISGTSSTSGVHILNVSNPAAPVQVGLYNPPYYIHDVHVRGNRMYAAALGQGLDIVDITNKSSPTLIRKITYPNQFTHSSWTTEDHRFLFVADEVDGLPARIWNIEDLNNVYEVAQYTANVQSLVHNPYIRGDFAFIAHNTEGLRVVDIADPRLPVEVGYCDTYLGPSGGFNGLWSAYPYFPSGKIIGGDRQLGLLVWRFNGTRAGRMYGIVTDSLSGTPIATTQISIVETGRTTSSDASGRFKIGELPAAPQGYTLSFVKQNYITKSLTIVVSGGDSLWLDVQLVPVGTSVGDPREEPFTFQLHQNYPNPFNPSTTISFMLHASGFTSLKVYNLLGQEVATLVNEVKQAGRHEVKWEAQGLPSGVYFYRLQAGDFVETKKLVLLN